LEYLNYICTEPRKVLNFGNYNNNQPEIIDLKSKVDNNEISSLIISGESGSGITHILNAICNTQLQQNKRVMYITAQWLLYIYKLLISESEKEQFYNFILEHDSVAIDNIQFLHRKTKNQSNFILSLIKLIQENHKTILLGCSNASKDITKSEKKMQGIRIKRIELNQLSSYDIFKVLKQLCSPEDQIPELLLYAISGYNGMIQQHINCLISVRFNPKLKEIQTNDLSIEDFEKEFELKKYFPKQQLRKSFIQTQLMFILEKEKIKFKVV
jgi:chromosomal replication initiation ATPase DnaA